MNGNRYQQTGNQNTRSQQNRYQNGFQQPRQLSRRELLDLDVHDLERELSKIDSEIDGIGTKSQLLVTARETHMQVAPLAIAQVALSTLGMKYLPPVARLWYTKYQGYNRAEEALRFRTAELWEKRNGLNLQIEQVQTEIELLQFQP